MRKHNGILTGAFLGFILLISLARVPVERVYAVLSQGDLTPVQTLNSADSGTRVNYLKQYGNVPLHFEANRGQADEKVKFLHRGHGHSLFLTDSEAVLTLGQLQRGKRQNRPFRESDDEGKDFPPEVVRISLTGSNSHPDVTGLEELPGKVNYFIGNDPNKWRTNVPTYKKVRYEEVYPGIDLIFYGKQGSLEYDLLVHPGADHEAVRIAFSGVDGLEIDDGGDLLLHTPSGDVRLRKPHIYQKMDGATREIDGGYLIQNTGEVSFRVAGYDKKSPLIIDPVLSYSTYLGGNSFDYGYGIAVDSAGCAYVTGDTNSTDFPTENAFQVYEDGWDVFVTKFNPSGTILVYSTYLGGNGNDYSSGIAVDSTGCAYVTGNTQSDKFPAVNAYRDSYVGGGGMFGGDAFVTKFDSSGSILAYSTYLGGGDGGDSGYAIAVDSSGCAYVTGETNSTDFPTENAFQGWFGGGIWEGGDAFVTKFDPSGSTLAYSTYLGGEDNDTGHGIAVDSIGYAYVTGGTSSTGFPAKNAYQEDQGHSDAFVTKFDPSGSTLAYSTYLGGENNDSGYGIAVDSDGSVYVAGRTSSLDFPTSTEAYQASKLGSDDVFITKFDPSGSSLAYSTYLGGGGHDSGRGIAIDSSGCAYVTGETNSSDLPTVYAFQASHGDEGTFQDAFVTKLDPSGSSLAYSTYLGGNGEDYGNAIAVDPLGCAYVTGLTTSTDFHTVDAYQRLKGTETDAFVIKLTSREDLVPTLEYSWNMDADPGWTVEGLWSWGQPTGGGGQFGSPDPLSGYTGSNVYGYNLSGDYENDLPERHLTTGAIDCSGISQVKLKFWRWLGVEQNFFDHAYVLISNDGSTWTTLWQNSMSNTEDATWTLQEFDISDMADGQPTLYIRWIMGPTDSSEHYCGWNIDDVEIWGVRGQDLGSCPVKIPGTPDIYFEDIRSSYDNAVDQDFIQIRVWDFQSDLVLDHSIGITLDGGYDCLFESVIGKSCIRGCFKIQAGCVTLKGMAIGAGP